jgi:release factor glutamine methyltransferase
MVTAPSTGRASDPPEDPVCVQSVEVEAEALLTWRGQMLAEGGGAADLDWLLDLAGGLTWPDLQALHLHPGRRICLRRSLVELSTVWERHLRTAEPLQYLVGVCPWRDLLLAVGPGVLIPRQETELLVELALELAPSLPVAEPMLWADLGTGSGCLAIALARALPRSRGFAVDASPAALGIAALNLERAGLQERVSLLQSGWWEGLQPWWGQLSLAVANPPYIPTATMATLDPVVRDHEPRLALDGGVDGLDSIRQVVAGAPRALAPGGLLLLEHHHDQSAAVAALLAQSGLVAEGVHRDLEGTLRFASARRSPLPVTP